MIYTYLKALIPRRWRRALLPARNIFSNVEWRRKAARAAIWSEVEMFFRDQAHRAHIKPLELKPVNRSPGIIVSLTSIPPRLPKLHLVIKSILRQTVQPDKIILWLSKEHAREDIGALSASDIPSKLSALQSRGLEICWTEDVGSFRKLLPSLQRFPEEIIITIDDDAYYDRKLIERLYSAYLREGRQHVYCGRSRVIKRRVGGDGGPEYSADELNFSSDRNAEDLFSVGVGGVLYPPKVFDKEIFKQDVFLKMVPYEDDIWFNVMVKLRGMSVFQVNTEEVALLPNSGYKSLATRSGKGEFSRTTFDRQLTELIRHYGLKL